MLITLELNKAFMSDIHDELEPSLNGISSSSSVKALPDNGKLKYVWDASTTIRVDKNTVVLSTSSSGKDEEFGIYTQQLFSLLEAIDNFLENYNSKKAIKPDYSHGWRSDNAGGHLKNRTDQFLYWTVSEIPKFSLGGNGGIIDWTFEVPGSPDFIEGKNEQNINELCKIKGYIHSEVLTGLDKSIEEYRKYRAEVAKDL